MSSGCPAPVSYGCHKVGVPYLLMGVITWGLLHGGCDGPLQAQASQGLLSLALARAKHACLPVHPKKQKALT